MRLCLCGCDRPLDGLRADAKYYSDACRRRAHREAHHDGPTQHAIDAFWAAHRVAKAGRTGKTSTAVRALRQPCAAVPSAGVSHGV